MYSGTKIAKASYLRPYTREDSRDNLTHLQGGRRYLRPYTREDSPLIEGKEARPIT